MRPGVTHTIVKGGRLTEMENTIVATEMPSENSMEVDSIDIKKLRITCPGCGGTRAAKTKCSNCGMDLLPLIAIRQFPTAISKQAEAAIHKGDLNRATELLNAAIALDPSSLESTLLLVDVYLRKKMLTEADALLQRAESIDPDNAVIAEKKSGLNKIKAHRIDDRQKGCLSTIIPTVLVTALVIGAGWYLLSGKTNNKKQMVQPYSVVDSLYAHLRIAGIKDSCSIIIDTAGKSVSFTGTVPDEAYKQIIQNVAGLYFPDSLINVNRLKVLHLKNPDQGQKRKVVLQYRVRKGETLSSIARNFLGKSDLWKTLYMANKETIVSNNRIYTGQTILIPLEVDLGIETGH